MAYTFQCTGNEGIMSGVGKCLPKFSDVKYALILPKGATILKTALTGASFAPTGGAGLWGYVKDGTVIPLPRVLVKTPATVEPKTKEVAGEMKYIGDPELRATLTISDIFGCLQTELRKMNNGSYSIIVIDSNSKYLAKEHDANSVKGFVLSQQYVSQINAFVANGENAETDLMITIDPSEFDGELAYGDVGFPASDINGLVKCAIEYGTVTTSAIVVNVTESCNSAEPVTGLEAENFTLTQGGAGVSITTVVESSTVAGEYTITATTTANPLSVIVAPNSTASTLLYKSALTTYTPA